MHSGAVAAALESESVLLDYFPTCNLIYCTPREKVLADGVLQGIQESTLTDIFHHYNLEENCDVYLICGGQAPTWDAVKLFQEAYERTGRAYFVPNYFKDKLKQKQKQRPMSAAYSSSFCGAVSSNGDATSRGSYSDVVPPLLIGTIAEPVQVNNPHEHRRFQTEELDMSALAHGIASVCCGSTKLQSQPSLIPKNNNARSNDYVEPNDECDLSLHVITRQRPEYAKQQRSKHCQMYRQSSPAYLRYVVDSSKYLQKTGDKNQTAILDSLPVPYITNHNHSNNASTILEANSGSSIAPTVRMPKARIQYKVLDILGRYRCKSARNVPREWDYLVTLNPAIFTTNFVHQRVSNYLDFWNMEEY